MKWLWHLTGGRPMRHRKELFYDGIARRMVHMFEDRLGRQWMAFGAWSMFRVPWRRQCRNAGEVGRG